MNTHLRARGRLVARGLRRGAGFGCKVLLYTLLIHCVGLCSYSVELHVAWGLASKQSMILETHASLRCFCVYRGREGLYTYTHWCMHARAHTHMHAHACTHIVNTHAGVQAQQPVRTKKFTQLDPPPPLSLTGSGDVPVEVLCTPST